MSCQRKIRDAVLAPENRQWGRTHHEPGDEFLTILIPTEPRKVRVQLPRRELNDTLR